MPTTGETTKRNKTAKDEPKTVTEHVDLPELERSGPDYRRRGSLDKPTHPRSGPKHRR